MRLFKNYSIFQIKLVKLMNNCYEIFNLKIFKINLKAITIKLFKY